MAARSKKPPTPTPPPANPNWKAGLILLFTTVVLLALLAWALWPAPTYTVVPVIPPPPPRAFVLPDEKATYAEYAGSQSCAGCHAKEYESWKSSHHGLAERTPQPDLDLEAFTPTRSFQSGTQSTEVSAKDGQFFIKGLGFQNQVEPYPVKRVIGHDPLRQFLIEGPRGALHAMEACFDPKVNDWFNVFGQEDRKPGEWGHWTGRGMIWNQMCASCHNTRVRKNYDLESDTYDTHMAELTVSCESCHGPMKAHHDWQVQQAGTGKKDPHLIEWTRDQHVENCAGCHARRGEITGDFVPGDSFWDHYLLTITDSTDLYYPDGQIRDENYEFSSFLSSRMHHAGVRCMDCHDMHSMKTLLPGNQLCMRCHTAGGFPNAPAIQPEMHSFHSTESTGNQCINCHMPQTTYMQRHPRHDHGFTIPDPLLTRDFGIPNACNKCHQDRDTDWALAATDKWWGEKMNRKTRNRATLIAQARRGEAQARDPLLAMLDGDEMPHWKASICLVLEPWSREAAVVAALLKQLSHEHPLVRQSALRTLEPALDMPGVRKAVEACQNDPMRNVRVTAAWALRDRADPQHAATQDLETMLKLNADQPSGQMQLGQWHFARGDTTKAIQHLETATRWDPNSPPFFHDLALMYSTIGNTEKTVEKLRAAIQLAPQEPQYHYDLALALSEKGAITGTITSLRECVKLQPRFARAWYNLGIALHQTQQSQEAIQALRQGELADPNDPAISYARATIHYQLKQLDETREAVMRTLRLAPNHPEALQLMRSLPR